MTQVVTNALPRIRSTARRSAVVFAALASVGMLVSPIYGALGAQTTQVRDVDDPGRIPYQSLQQVKAGPTLEFDFPVVPAGHRLVIQHVSGDVNLQSIPNNQVEALVEATGGASSFFVPFSKTLARFDQPIQLYVDAGEAPIVVVLADLGITPTDHGFVTLTGYLLDCAAAPCAKIAK